MHPPDTPPATSVSMCVVIDTQTLCAKSPGGNLYYIDSIDEFSGDVQVTPAKSLKAVNIFSALMSLVYTRYNAYELHVVHFVSNSLPALEALVPMLSMMGILHSLCAPGQFAQRVESSVGHSASYRRAVYASIPFWVPAKYDVYAKVFVAQCRNQYSNSRSRPSTADILVTGRPRTLNARIPYIKFGDTCMASVSVVKRHKVAVLEAVSIKGVSKMELGVCLGYSLNSPGAFEFLLANGEIVSRNQFKRVNVTPFDWKRKVVIQAELAPPSTGLSLSQGSVQGLPLVLDPPSPSSAAVPISPLPSSWLSSAASVPASVTSVAHVPVPLSAGPLVDPLQPAVDSLVVPDALPFCVLMMFPWLLWLRLSLRC